MLLSCKSFGYVTEYNNGSVGCSMCECKYDKHKMIQMYWQCNGGRKNCDLAPHLNVYVVKRSPLSSHSV